MLLTLLILVGIVLLVSYGSRIKFLSSLFRITPVPFWCYFLPMVLATLGILPRESIVYTFFSKQLLPICLVFLLIGTDLRSIAKLGKTALVAMFTGTIGILIGAVSSFVIFERWLPENSWMGFGALTGSWIGGSANMLAVKEGLGVPDSIFAPLVIVDAFLAYSWMGILIAASGWQRKWDKRIDKWDARTIPPTVIARSPATEGGGATKQSHEIASTDFVSLAMTTLLALTLSLLSQWLGSKLPTIGGIFTSYTWTILLVTTLSLGFSLTPLSRFSTEKTMSLGYFLLFLLLTSIGAKVDIRSILTAPLFLAAGAVWILIHAVILLLVGRLCRIPLFFLATASQANIGGPVSAPIVAAVYQPKLASIGLLMAILGNVMGTYLGLLSASICRVIGG